MTWTDSDDANLTALWRAGATVEAIAADLSRTVAAVNRRRAILGLKVRKRGRKRLDNTVQVSTRIPVEQEALLPGKGDRARWFREAIEEKLKRNSG